MASQIQDSDYPTHGVVEYVPKHDTGDLAYMEQAPSAAEPAQVSKYDFRKTLLGYIKTKQFWIVLCFGSVDI
jgi:hypothetical protein